MAGGSSYTQVFPCNNGVGGGKDDEMTSLRAHRFLIFVTALAMVSAFTGAVASATCGGGEEGGETDVELTPDKWHAFFEQEQTFTVKNSGTVNITSLTVSLISPEGGLKITHNTCGSTLGVGATCTVTVECLKQDEASLSAIVHSPAFAIDTSVLQCTVI